MQQDFSYTKRVNQDTLHNIMYGKFFLILNGEIKMQCTIKYAVCSRRLGQNTGVQLVTFL